MVCSGGLTGGLRRCWVFLRRWLQLSERAGLGVLSVVAPPDRPGFGAGVLLRRPSAVVLLAFGFASIGTDGFFPGLLWFWSVSPGCLLGSVSGAGDRRWVAVSATGAAAQPRATSPWQSFGGLWRDGWLGWLALEVGAASARSVSPGALSSQKTRQPVGSGLLPWSRPIGGPGGARASRGVVWSLVGAGKGGH